MSEYTHVDVTERSRSLANYSQKMIEPSSSKFIEVFSLPVLLYSRSPGWLEDIWCKLKDTLNEFNDNQPLLHPAKTGPYIDDIQLIEIRKYTTSTPANKITVGREASNDIVFSHGAISNFHAYLAKTEPNGSYEIIDANSTNGTVVNDQELPAFKRQPLINLDQIEFGKAVRAVYLTPRGLYELVQDLTRLGIM